MTRMTRTTARKRYVGAKRSIAPIVALTLLAACSSPSVRLGPRPPANPALLGTVKGSACGLLVFGVMPIGVNERVAEASREARVAAGRQSVTDVRLSERWYIVPLLGTVLCTDIEETAVQ